MLSSEPQAELQCYSNDLHDALISKSGVNFWKWWKSKFEKDRDNSMKVIDGLSDDSQIAEVLAEHFRNICTNLNEDRNIGLRNSYQERRQDYIGDPLLDIMQSLSSRYYLR